MLHVQPATSSMPSTLVSGYHPHHDRHILPQLREFNWDWNTVKSRAGKVESLPGLASHDAQCTVTSSWPKMNVNPIHNPVIPVGQYVTPQTISSHAPAYPPPQSHSRQNSSGRPFYQSYYSARQNQSPPTRQVITSDRTESARRRASSDGNTIAPSLQIPTSINSSRGSLPEFAAQITCLFWFESSQTLQLAQDTKLVNMIPAPLNADAMPSTGFRKWVTTVLSMTQVTPNVIILALMFIYRLKSMNPSVKGKVGSEFRLLTVALMLGNKFLDDNTYTNKTWAEVSGISVQEIHVMEVEFLSNMRYSLFVKEEKWDEWHRMLGTFAEYYDRAAEVAARASSAVFARMPILPSPPVSAHTSPPLARTSPGNSSLSHSQPMAPMFTPATVSPVSLPPPESDPMKQWGRKRSLEDSQMEHPAKRMSSYMPSTAASSSALTPSSLGDPNTPMPMLPLPNIPSAVQHGGQGTPPGQLPMPMTRAMASIFPTPSRWPSNAMQLPSLPPAQHLGHPGNTSTNSSANAIPNRPSPYGSASGTSSPTSYAFPHQGTTPAGLSPSGMPLARNSPYKPVRGVHTLLVPPPSAAVYQAPQQVSYNQMHYQPLGQPKTERRTGVLPRLSFDTRSQLHQM